MSHILEQIRHQRRLSRDELAALSASTRAGSVTVRTIQNIERYGNAPRRRTAQALGEALGVDAMLFYDHEPVSSRPAVEAATHDRHHTA